MNNPYDEIKCDRCGLSLGYAIAHDMNGGYFYCFRHTIEDIFNGDAQLAEALLVEAISKPFNNPLDIEGVEREKKMIQQND